MYYCYYDMSSRPRLVILVGPRGSGKTTLGSSLSEVFPVHFLLVESNLELSIGEDMSQNNTRKYKSEQDASQGVLNQLIEASKLYPVLLIESTGAELASELGKYKRLFDVSLVRVRAPLEVCLARARIRDKAGGEEVNASNQAAQSLSVEWALTFENLDPLPSKAQIRNTFAPLFSSFSSSSCPPAIVHTSHASVPLSSTAKNPKQGGKKVRSCLKKNTEESRRGIQWDEPNLQQNEDEKVPRMKIDEPKTPYNYIDADDVSGFHTPAFNFQSESDGDEAMAPRHERRNSYGESKGQSLTEVDVESLASEALRRREAEWEDSEGEEIGMTFKERKLEQQRQSEFEEKRKQHYNMGSLLKRQKSPVVDEETEQN